MPIKYNFADSSGNYCLCTFCLYFENWDYFLSVLSDYGFHFSHGTTITSLVIENVSNIIFNKPHTLQRLASECTNKHSLPLHELPTFLASRTSHIQSCSIKRKKYFLDQLKNHLFKKVVQCSYTEYIQHFTHKDSGFEY